MEEVKLYKLRGGRVVDISADFGFGYESGR